MGEAVAGQTDRNDAHADEVKERESESEQRTKGSPAGTTRAFLLGGRTGRGRRGSCAAKL
jgi:hypothetical protein